jgi:hypothetical protein
MASFFIISLVLVEIAKKMPRVTFLEVDWLLLRMGSGSDAYIHFLRREGIGQIMGAKKEELH